MMAKPQSLYKQPEFLIDLKITAFLKERNILWVLFLCGLTNPYCDYETKQVLYIFASTLEKYYHLHNLNLVLPHSFLANLVQSNAYFRI